MKIYSVYFIYSYIIKMEIKNIFNIYANYLFNFNKEKIIASIIGLLWSVTKLIISDLMYNIINICFYWI